MSNVKVKYRRDKKLEKMKLETAQKFLKGFATAAFVAAIGSAIFVPADGVQAYFVGEGMSDLPYEVQLAEEKGVKHYDFLKDGEPVDHITADAVVEQVGLDNGYQPIVLDQGTQVLAGAQEDYTGKAKAATAAAAIGAAALAGSAYTKRRKEEIEDELDEIENYSEVDQPRRRKTTRQTAQKDVYVRPTWRSSQWPNVPVISPRRSGRPRFIQAGTMEGTTLAIPSYSLREEQTRSR